MNTETTETKKIEAWEIAGIEYTPLFMAAMDNYEEAGAAFEQDNAFGEEPLTQMIAPVEQANNFAFHAARAVLTAVIDAHCAEQVKQAIHHYRQQMNAAQK